jgi:hypothetical protein
VQQPPQPVFFNTRPGPTGTQTRKGILNYVQTRSEKEELPRKGDPETRGCSQHRGYDSLPHNGEARGTGTAILGTEIGRRDPPGPSDSTNQITSPDPGLGDYGCRGRRKQVDLRGSFVLPYGIDGWSHRTVPQDCIESLAGVFSHGFPRHSLKIFMSRLSSQTRP